MVRATIEEKLKVLPAKPGCYLMKDKYGTVIYVGKSKMLRNRVRSYFIGAHDEKTQRLVMEINDFEYIVTSSEIDALILEMNLIKKYNPKYNVMLKDDKSYPYLKNNERTPSTITNNSETKKRRRKILWAIYECHCSSGNEKIIRPYLSTYENVITLLVDIAFITI